MTNIYCLYDPRDSQQIPMYVGKGLAKRAQSHWKFFLRNIRSVSALLRRWFEKLRSAGVEPAWKFLEEGVENWEQRERQWIAYWRWMNPELCNFADGGYAPPSSSEISSLAGRVAHILHPNLAKENGKLVHKLYPQRASNLGKKYGPIGGKATKESTNGRKEGRSGGLQTAKLRSKDSYLNKKLCEAASIGGRRGGLKGGPIGAPIANHNRWHLLRGVISPNCKLCKGGA